MQDSSRRGFTLIELMLVVVIIGVIAASALLRHAHTKQRGLRSAAMADLHTLLVAQERFHYETGRYGGIADTAALRSRLSPGNGPLAITLTGVPVAE